MLVMPVMQHGGACDAGGASDACGADDAGGAGDVGDADGAIILVILVKL